MRAPTTAIVGVGLAAVAIVGCAPSSGDFVVDAEAFLRSDEMFDTYGLDLPDPACSEPTSMETGATVTCTGVAQDEMTYVFSFEITGRRNLTLRAITLAES